jgi:hypothetical protein
MPDRTAPQPYKLRLPHQHGGIVHPAGTELELRPDQIERVRAAEDAALKTAKQALTGQEKTDA